MAQNITPIYLLKGDLAQDAANTISPVIVNAANDVTGAGANNILIFTAGVDGSFIQRIRFKPVGTNSAASMIRLFLNNGSANTTATNNSFLDEIPLPVSTISTTVPLQIQELPLNILIPPNWRIYAGLTVAGTAGWQCIPIAGTFS